MVNLIGEIPGAVRSLDIGVLHDYGKSPRPGRKLGHVTVTAETAAECDKYVDIIERSVT
jgi:5-(carboxyamino)imidazole ribonucleotide synthase